MKRLLPFIMIMVLCSAFCGFADSWSGTDAVRYKTSGTDGQLLLWSSTSGYVRVGVDYSDLATTNWVHANYYPRNNPSNWVDESVTNGLYPASNPSNWVTEAVTNGLYPRNNPSNFTTKTYVDAGDLTRSGSGYIHGKTQDFTALGGWQIITNYLSAGSQNMGTLTSSNLTTIADGTYLLFAPYSVKSDKNNTDILIHAYTNNVNAVNASTGVELPNLTKFGSCTLIARLQLVSNVVIDLRCDVNLDVELTFEHASATLMWIGPLD